MLPYRPLKVVQKRDNFRQHGLLHVSHAGPEQMTQFQNTIALLRKHY
jgi:hypothetical protein